jgi:hypothetical protein
VRDKLRYKDKRIKMRRKLENTKRKKIDRDRERRRVCENSKQGT